MVSDFTQPAETLGQRLDRLAGQLIAARSPAFAWLMPLQGLLDHLATLPGPIADRFDRVEAVAAAVDFHDRIPAARKMIGPGDTGAVGADGLLPSDIHSQLRRVIGWDAEAMRVHDDRAADLLARRHRADAVTVGRHVYFRQGRLRPRDPQGFALIAHEATHVAESLAPGAAWRRLTGAGRRDEERLAESNERRASLDGIGPGPVGPAAPWRSVRPRTGPLAPAVIRQDGPQPASPPTAARPAPATPAPQPMRAPDDRTAEPSPPLDVEELQRSLLRELKRQLLTEFERGA